MARKKITSEFAVVPADELNEIILHSGFVGTSEGHKWIDREGSENEVYQVIILRGPRVRVKKEIVSKLVAEEEPEEEPDE